MSNCVFGSNITLERNSLRAVVTKSASEDDGTTYTLTLQKYASRKWSDVTNADVSVTVTDQYGATASQKFRINGNGDFTLVNSNVTIGDGIDALSGATVTSTAVVNAINGSYPVGAFSGAGIP